METPFLILDRTPSMKFSKGMVRLKYIQHIQDDLARQKVAKVNTKIYFLNQTYILHLVARWQVFIEALARYGFEKIAEKEVSGMFRDVAASRLSEALKRFNTPNRANIDKLFKEVLGISDVSQSWICSSLPDELGPKTLKELLETRHEIAHTGYSEQSLSYHSNYEKMEILTSLAGLTEQRVLETIANRYPN